MPTAIDMCSNALLLIGDNPINSFDEAGAGAQAAKAFYSTTKKSLLAWHPWSFALKERQLSRLTATPDKRTGYTHAYQVPTDMIRVWAVVPFARYTIVGDKLYSNQDSLFMRYVYDVDDTQIPEPVVEALEYKLASKFAVSVTEDENKAAMYANKYLEQIASASTQDSQNRPQESIVSSPFTDARMQGVSPFSGGIY